MEDIKGVGNGLIFVLSGFPTRHSLILQNCQMGTADSTLNSSLHCITNAKLKNILVTNEDEQEGSIEKLLLNFALQPD